MDAAATDARVDAALADGDVDAATGRPSATWLSSGGGTGRSANFVVSVTVGGPIPSGKSASANYRVSFSPPALP